MRSCNKGLHKQALFCIEKDGILCYNKLTGFWLCYSVFEAWYE